ncbi:MAG: SHOCT domain-containing protein, partial [Bacteroidota bacterium]
GAGSLIKLIPGIGSLLGGVTVSIFAGASTYALGEVFKKHFSSGGTILDFDPGRLRKMYKEKFEKGKKVVTEWKQEMDAEEKEAEKGGSVEEVVQTAAPEPKAANPSPAMSQDVIDQLSKLGELKAAGVISEEEFQQMKQKLIDSF